MSGRLKEGNESLLLLSLDLDLGKAIVLKTSSDLRASRFFPALAFFFSISCSDEI